MALSGKKAVVTGSTSGIGLGIAHALAAQGVSIMLNGFGDAREIEQLRADTAAKYNVKVAFNGADLSKPAEVAALIAAANTELGGVDILVNNAGIQHVASIEEFPLDKWDAVIAINMSSCFHSTRAALPLMRKSGWGRIVNIASAHGLVGSAHKSAYVTAKHGVIGLTKVTALETATTNITCNAICPGWVLTPLVQKQIDAIAAADKITNDQAKAKLLSEKQPSLAFATPDDIGQLVVFLTSEAAAQIRGASLTVDGGWTAQ
jgi:3-hydroxybutyrate dehydrogenase